MAITDFMTVRELANVIEISASTIYSNRAKYHMLVAYLPTGSFIASGLRMINIASSAPLSRESGLNPSIAHKVVDEKEKSHYRYVLSTLIRFK